VNSDAAGPSPLPFFPWQAAQYHLKISVPDMGDPGLIDARSPVCCDCFAGLAPMSALGTSRTISKAEIERSVISQEHDHLYDEMSSQ
jgi:hypothetical protein